MERNFLLTGPGHLIPLAIIPLVLACSLLIGGPGPGPTYAYSQGYDGEFSVDPKRGYIGDTIEARGTGFEPNTDLEILWQEFEGSWKVEGAEFQGREFTGKLEQIATVKTDEDGNFTTQFEVPKGFGFTHDVVVSKAGEVLNKAGFSVNMEVSISPKSGPTGTPITVEVRGIGWRPLENSWVLSYDNNFTGWLSSVTTDGVARATIPATGEEGTHVLKIVHGAFTFPYLNMQQSPRPDRPTFTRKFTIKSGTPDLPPSPGKQALQVKAGDRPGGDGPLIWTDPRSGPVGTSFEVKGEGFPEGEAVKLLWYRVTGNRVSGGGWKRESDLLEEVTPDEEGEFQTTLKAPDDLGGIHRIEAKVNGEKLARTKFNIKPSVVDVKPTEGPAGTETTIHLKGVGWTETANIYTVVYDNSYLGYSCGFNSQGDIKVNLPISGSPGWHFIDLYPAIYKGERYKRTNNFRIPQLTYKTDHPGENLPAFRFAVKVTE